jgi:hypothetical protein
VTESELLFPEQFRKCPEAFQAGELIEKCEAGENIVTTKPEMSGAFRQLKLSFHPPLNGLPISAVLPILKGLRSRYCSTENQTHISHILK